MTDSALNAAVRRLYWLTGLFGIIGFVSYSCFESIRSALAFGLGVGGSLGNLWLFDWLAGAISSRDQVRKPWSAGLFISRYAVLFFAGYVIVKALKVSGLAVVLGLLASTAAVLFLLIAEMIQTLLRNRPS